MNTDFRSKESTSTLQIIILAFLLGATPPLFGADTLPEAVHRGDAARIRSLLAGQPDLQARDVDGNTALHWAALNGDALMGDPRFLTS